MMNFFIISWLFYWCGVSNGSGVSYSVINKVYILGVNSTSGTFNMTFYGESKNKDTISGNAMTNVYGWGNAFYISSGTMSIS